VSPSPNPDDAHAAVGIPPYVWEYIGWAIKGLITFCFGWVIVLYRDVQSIKTWRARIDVAASFRDQQRGELLEIVKEVLHDIKAMQKDHGERIAALEGRNEGEDR
jgi:hypothetical protein